MLQGLLAIGHQVKEADRRANTPTKRLPECRKDLACWKAYQGLIEAGVEIFWSIYSTNSANIYGLPTLPGIRVNVAETYPRYTIRNWWPDLKIPSKRNASLDYVNAVWENIKKQGYRCSSVVRPSVDQVDAMLCALGALSLTWCTRGEPAGKAPIVDFEDQILREGYVV